MRKWIVWLLLLLVVFFAAVYFFIPDNITVRKEARINVNAKAFTREFLHEGSGTLSPQDKEANHVSNGFVFNGNRFTPLQTKLASQLYAVQQKDDSMLAELVVIPFQVDSVALSFVGVTKAGWNPLSRVAKLLWAKKVAADFDALLKKTQAYYSNMSNVYGYAIQRELVADTSLISTFRIVHSYPDNALIYGLIDKLKAYAQKNKAEPSGFPMLNVTANDDSSYVVRVALPLNKRLNDEGDIRHKWMMGGGNILTAEVKGGPTKIKQAFAVTKLYVNDHDWATAAIPFESMVTDRRAEPDTNKWVTRIYWPVR